MQTQSDGSSVAARCEFHGAYVQELAAMEPFHAVTTILVSQFITDRARRVDFFRDLAQRLQPDGVLITADLTTAPAGQHEGLLGVWLEMMRHVGAEEAQIQTMLAAYGRDVALLTVAEIESLLADAGFVAPVRFSQSLLIQAWFARKA